LCCFDTQETDTVNLHLSSLEESLKKVVHPDYLPQLFLLTEGLSFKGQMTPPAKGRNRIPQLDVPAPIENYVNQSMQRIYNPTPKRQATQMDPSPIMSEDDHPPLATPIPRKIPQSYATAPSTISPATTVTPPAIDLALQQSSSDPLMQELKATSQLHSSALLELKNCCSTLVQTQQTMAKQITEMNIGINQRFETMSATIESLKNSPD
jgi:hypothetical protein